MRWMLLTLAVLAAAPAAADPIYDMCIRPGKQGPEQCDCVTDGLGRALSSADHALYSAVARRYLERRGEGMATADAWDAAVQSEAMARNVGYVQLVARTDEIARRHREISEGCAGG